MKLAVVFGSQATIEPSRDAARNDLAQHVVDLLAALAHDVAVLRLKRDRAGQHQASAEVAHDHADVALG